MSEEFRVSVPADHPALAGHFPDRPVVPGSILLEAVMIAFARWQSAVTAARIVSVKFLRPVPPAAEIAIVFAALGATRVRFEGRLGRELAFAGELATEARGPAA